MSTNGNGGGGAPTGGPSGTERAIPDTIDFVYDQTQEGNVAANDTIRGSDYTRIEGDNSTASNEIMEVVKMELIPPTNSDGSLQTADAIRLWDGSNYYPQLRFREFMMGYFGPDFTLSTPAFGTPVLSGDLSPGADPIQTATPKYGTSTTVSPAWVNDGTAVTDSFRLRLHVWRWQGSGQELQNYITNLYGTTTFSQNISMSNPYTGNSQTYTRSDPVRITPGADGGALGQFTELTGGIEQSLPKVYPWVTWSENNNATRANREYQFTTTNDRVDESWKQLEFDYTDAKSAVWFDTVQVNQPANLDRGIFSIEERDQDPEAQLTPNSAHQLPIVRPLDGTTRDEFSTDELPVRINRLLNSKQMIWDDGGGFRIVDEGTSIPANTVLIGVTGRKLELTS